MIETHTIANRKQRFYANDILPYILKSTSVKLFDLCHFVFGVLLGSLKVTLCFWVVWELCLYVEALPVPC
jgi:hypothetical protein